MGCLSQSLLSSLSSREKVRPSSAHPTVVLTSILGWFPRGKSPAQPGVMCRWPLQRDTLSYGFIQIPGKTHKSRHRPAYVCPTPSFTSWAKRLLLSLWSRCTYGHGERHTNYLFLLQKIKKLSLEIPQPSSLLLQEEISISLQIFYFFFLNPL